MTERITLLERDKTEDVTEAVDDGVVDLMEDDIGVSDYDLESGSWPGVPDIPLPEAYIWREPTQTPPAIESPDDKPAPTE